MEGFVVHRKRVTSNTKPFCEAEEFYSVDRVNWMTPQQFFHFKNAHFADTFSKYDEGRIKKEVNACIAGYGINANQKEVDAGIKSLLDNEPCVGVHNIGYWVVKNLMGA